MLFGADGRDVVVSVGDAKTCCPLRDLINGSETHVELQGQGYPLARSRDGKLLAIYDAGDGAIAIVPVDGGPRRTLARQIPGLASTNFAFSPDGRYLFFVAKQSLMRIGVEGGDPVSTGVTLPVIYDLSLNPDGRRFALTNHVYTSDVWIWENVVSKSK